MDNAVSELISARPAEIQAMFCKLRELALECAPAAERLWAGMPSYYVGERFVRLIPFGDHINIEASALALWRERLSGYKFTPKGMLQLFVGQPLPRDVLLSVFSQTLNGKSGSAL